VIVFTVTKGAPSEEELAAVLLALTAVSSPPDLGRPAAGWRRPERAQDFPEPRSWRRWPQFVNGVAKSI
jgi:hypothetical protein